MFVGDALIQAQFDLAPIRGLGVDRFVIGMTRGLGRQDRAAEGAAAVGMHGAARALGKARRPMADRHHFQAPSQTEAFDHGAQGVQVRRDGPVGRCGLALQIGADRAPAGQFERYAQFLQFIANQADDLVRHAGGAGGGQEFGQNLDQIIPVDEKVVLHAISPRLFAGCSTISLRVSGNRKSTNFCAVGCGSWLARPGRSFASMIR